MVTSELILDRNAAATRPSALPMRGAIVALIAVGLGVAIIRPSAAGPRWGDAAVLAVLAVTAFLGANEARRLVQAREQAAEREGASTGWMTVIVGSEGPIDTAGIMARPKAPPRSDPERRSLLRRARERRQSTVSQR